jgi:hypothetical protein
LVKDPVNAEALIIPVTYALPVNMKDPDTSRTSPDAYIPDDAVNAPLTFVVPLMTKSPPNKATFPASPVNPVVPETKKETSDPGEVGNDPTGLSAMNTVPDIAVRDVPLLPDIVPINANLYLDAGYCYFVLRDLRELFGEVVSLQF